MRIATFNPHRSDDAAINEDSAPLHAAHDEDDSYEVETGFDSQINLTGNR